ncbi:CD63 antigen [Eurytemora carolleeae]|uniref:CD63 antigen n=1 Tax=Eurytemora carolleeae TaxID=1294199 RepID=UPI000C759005|nr:CD63 antigen [Eurytemora carolleeae]|eukprot:XP_023329530.1 CD63 antigen-like [Eurytemora affinis]
MEVVIGLVAYHTKDKLMEWLEKNLVAGMENFQKTGFGGVTETWNVIQHELGCCGVRNYRDWENTSLLQRASVPDSCCLSDVVGCGSGILKLYQDQASLRIHTTGCITPLYQIFEENIVYFYTIASILLFIQIFAIIFAIFFGNTVKKGLEHV